MKVIQGTSVVTLHAQVVLNANIWLQVPPAGEITWTLDGEDENSDVHVCAAAAAGNNNRTARIPTNPHLFQSIDFKTNTEEPFLYLLCWIPL